MSKPKQKRRTPAEERLLDEVMDTVESNLAVMKPERARKARATISRIAATVRARHIKPPLTVFEAWAVRLKNGRLDSWTPDSGMKGVCFLNSLESVRHWISGKPIRVKVTVEEL